MYNAILKQNSYMLCMQEVIVSLINAESTQNCLRAAVM